ncbi:MAG: HNH endonuclease [Bacteroidia bacterium]|nr:HNH endonuclease [Bacteroidia bacterium]
MSYEGKMLKDLKMPTRKEVEEALLKSLFYNNGIIKEFGAGEEIVDEIANEFNLNKEQRNIYLETIYKKENRLKKSSLWHRLLFRAADNLAKEKLVSRPSLTFIITNKKEWMLTEDGYDKALKLLSIPNNEKEILPVKSYEVQRIVKKINDQEIPSEYNPIEPNKIYTVSKEAKLRKRGFRFAIVEAYKYQCAICGLKLFSPNNLQWEVQAAHIVPHSLNGKDDIWNGLALCRLHHWTFDVGWFSLEDNFHVIASNKIHSIDNIYGIRGTYNFFEHISNEKLFLLLPDNQHHHPHITAIKWHRENIFCK